MREPADPLAGRAEPSPWWAESHQRILAAARALTWPTRPVDLETQACQVVGDEFYERLNSESGGLHPSRWLAALAEETGTALRASVADGSSDWQQLWALLCGLALTVPPGDPEDETVLADVDRAAKLLTASGLAADLELPAHSSRPAGNPLVARDAYGTRFLLVVPFGYNGEEVDHWYAWDIDACWLLNVVAAGVFESPQAALTEWQQAVGPSAGTDLSPSAPSMTARLLATCLQTGPMSGLMEGSEPRELIREHFRLRRRAHALVPAGVPSPNADDSDQVHEAFLNWYAARHGAVSEDTADAVSTILYEWGPEPPLEKRSRYATPPHRIDMAARVIRDAYPSDLANDALRLLPEWTQWCIDQTGLTGDLAARSRGAALTEAAALVDEAAPYSAAEREESLFRRQE